MSQTHQSVLVVDDDRNLCGLLSTVLGTSDRDVVCCHTAAEASEQLASRLFQLALLDIALPDGDGLELLRDSVPAHPQTRFVMMTGDDTAASVAEAIRGAAYDYLRKPFTPTDIEDLVDGWLASIPEPGIVVHSAKPEWIDVSLPCTRTAAERIGHFLGHLNADLPESLRDELSECVHELVMNAMEWGAGFDPARRVRVSSMRTARMLMYRIADPGPGFRFEQIPHAAIANESSDPLAYARMREEKGIRPGGLGLMIVRSRADELLYNEAQNEVTFIKYLDSAV